MDDRFSIARKDRDAWAAIRGYVYQVDTTILRWLKLGPEEVLELECGEDIDLLAPSIANGDQSVQRTLEQVKCLDGTLTLRSRSSLEALVSFVEHIQANPTLPLQFRFVTTAVPAEERPALPLAFTPGIVLWEQIRTGRIHPLHRVAAIESIAAFLQPLATTDSVQAGPWRNLVAITQDMSRFTDLISRFEWSVGASPCAEVVSEIEEAILRQGYASNRADAKIRHDQLFVFTMRLLASRKSEVPRRLNLSDLQASFKSGMISAAERRVLDELDSLHSLLRERFSDVEESIAGVKQDTEAIRQLLYTGKNGQDQLALHIVIDEPAIQDSFRAASSALLSWPQETEGYWLDRSELSTLENIIVSRDQSCTVLLAVRVRTPIFDGRLKCLRSGL